MLTRGRWRDIWRTLGADHCDDALHQDLLARYAEPHRHYHTAQHLTECFGHWEALRAESERPAEVELALWFHDAVYDPQRDDSEAQSAVLAREAIARAELPGAVGDRVATLIVATRHDRPPESPDAERLVDVDLAILGALPARFDEYEEQIRAEYEWVPDLLYRRKRREVLARFVERPSIYSTAHFRRVAEGQALENLRRSIARLRA